MTVANLTGFATACQEAMRAILGAISTGGEEWYLADHLRRGIKDVETRVRDAS